MSLLRAASYEQDVVFFRMTRTFLGRPRYWTGCYLVDEALIDCGPPALAHELLRALDGRPLRQLLITHHHEDHMGGAPLLAARRGLVPRIHALGVEPLAHGFPVEPYRRYAWGRPGLVRAEPLESEVKTRHATFQVLHTPGHSPDHVCLYEPDRGWLFAGDLFLGERLRYLREDEDLDGSIESLQRMSRLGVKELFCAHRGRIDGGAAALARKAEHLLGVRERVKDLLARGMPAAAIARRVVGPEGPLTLLSGGRFSARNFVRAVARSAAAGRR